MKLGQMIDEMQASLTKFRVAVRNLGIAGTKRDPEKEMAADLERIVQETITEATHRWAVKHGLTETAGELHRQVGKIFVDHLRNTARESEAFINIPPFPCIVCGKQHASGYGNAFPYCEDHIPHKATGTAGKCTFTTRSFIDELRGTPDKPICTCSPHTRATWPLGHKPVCPSYSDLPLHAKVAQVLEYTAWTDKNGKWRSNLGQYIPLGIEYPFIPDYPNDLVAAMGALEEYCRNYKPKKYGPITYAGVNFHPDKKMDAEPFHAMINHVVYNYGIGESATTAAEAICKVIIRHDNEQI